MSDEEFEAELFGPVTSQIFDATWLHDSQTGIWRAPLPYESERDQLRRIYLLDKRNTDPPLFDRVYPKLWRLDRQPKSSTRLIVAVLDTGCLTEHPLLADCIEETRDFTGEGVEDRIGHGTGSALIARMHLGLGQRPALLIGKVFPEDRRRVAKNLIQGIEWAAQHAGETAFVQIHLRLGVYHRRLFGLKACDGTCGVCTAAARAAENPFVWIDAAPGNRPGRTACPAMGAIRARRMAEPASPSAAAEVRFASQALREYSNSGVGTDVVEGTGTYNLWQDTVTLYPPDLYYRTLDPRMVVGIEAARRSFDEPFIAMRGSWSLVHISNRWIEVPHEMGAAGPDEDSSGATFGYGCDTHGLFFGMPALPGFVVRGDTTPGIHAQLPDAMRKHLTDHTELPELVREQATRVADLLGNSEGARRTGRIELAVRHLKASKALRSIKPHPSPDERP